MYILLKVAISQCLDSTQLFLPLNTKVPITKLCYSTPPTSVLYKRIAVSIQVQVKSYVRR